MSAVFLNTVCSLYYPQIRKGEITQWVLLPKQKQTQFLDIPNSDDWERKADPFLTLTTLISPSFNLCCRVRGGECILQVKKGELIVFFHFTQRICRKSCICLYHLSCLSCKQADTTINLLKICNRKLGSNISCGGTFDWFSSTVWVWQSKAGNEVVQWQRQTSGWERLWGKRLRKVLGKRLREFGIISRGMLMGRQLEFNNTSQLKCTCDEED